jgi:hypothetical protein
MPTHYRPDEKPIIQFDPLLEVSPFTLFRRLREGRAPRLIDVRRDPGERTLRGAERWEGDEWRPQENEEVVLFDEDGSEALPIVAKLQHEGYPRAKMLFGGLDLYEFSLDPQVVGDETFLELPSK